MHTITRAGRIELRSEAVAARLVFAGDLCATGRIEAYLLIGDRQALLHDLAPILADADLAVVNLECALCPPLPPMAKLGPNLRADPAVARALAASGIGVCCLANNHVMDYGQAGLAATLRALDDAGLRHTGAGLAEDEREAGLRVGRGAVSLSLLNVGVAEGAFAPEGPGICRFDPIDLLRRVGREAQAGQVTIPVIHTGREEVLFPAPRLRELCRALIEAGAAAVVCHHPHVPQGIEIHAGCPIAYSLGNFLFDWPEPEPHTDSSFLLELGVSPRGVTSVTVHPFRKHASGGGEALRDPQRAGFIDFLNDLAAPFADPATYRRLWTEQCRPQLQAWYATRLARAANLASRDPNLRLKAALTMLNLLEASEHGDVIREAIVHDALRGGTLDADARSRLDGLRERLCGFAGPDDPTGLAPEVQQV
jgi:hypothetical protein